MSKIRTFIAIEIPEPIKKSIAKIQDELIREGAHIAWVKPQKIHITLKFLGAVEEKLIDNMATALTEIAHQTRPFVVQVHGIGAFPNLKRPKVIWIGAVSENKALENLASTIDAQFNQFGFEKEMRPFRAHLTLGRVKGMRGIDSVMKKVENNKDYEGGNFTPAQLVIMKSDLKPTGAIYTPLKIITIE